MQQGSTWSSVLHINNVPWKVHCKSVLQCLRHCVFIITASLYYSASGTVYSSSLKVCITVPRALCILHHCKSALQCLRHCVFIITESLYYSASGTVYSASGTVYSSSLRLRHCVFFQSVPQFLGHHCCKSASVYQASSSSLQVYTSARGPSAASQTPMTWLSNNILPVCVVTMAPICSAYYRKRRTMILQYNNASLRIHAPIQSAVFVNRKIISSESSETLVPFPAIQTPWTTGHETSESIDACKQISSLPPPPPPPKIGLNYTLVRFHVNIHSRGN